jgi:Cys-rich protein (TIGR01571 family)
MWTIVVTWLALNALLFGAYNLKWSRGIELTHADWLSLLIVNAAMLFFGFYVTTNTRAALRTKFHIPEKRCYDLEDFYCGTFCMPCSICQMLRHTADYDNYDAECCSKFGVTPEATGLDSKGRRIV